MPPDCRLERAKSNLNNLYGSGVEYVASICGSTVKLHSYCLNLKQ